MQAGRCSNVGPRAELERSHTAQQTLEPHISMHGRLWSMAGLGWAPARLGLALQWLGCHPAISLPH